MFLYVNFQPKSMYGVDSAAKNALNAPDSLEIVDTMHAEIELLMLSGGYSRDVAVKMLLSKVAKEKALQQQSGVSITFWNFFLSSNPFLFL